MSQMRIWSGTPQQSPGVPFAKTFLTPIGNDSPLASRVCDAGGTTAWDELNPTRNTPYLVTVEAPGFAPYGEVHPNVFQDIDITLTPNGSPGPVPPSQGLTRLTLSGQGLFRPDGSRQFIRGADAFCGLEVFLRFGTAMLIPVWEQLRDRYRANCLRTWSMSVNLQANEFGRPPFDPREFPHYYSAVGEYFDFCASYGFWQYLGVFPDVQLISGDIGWQQAHWDQLWDILRDRDDLFGIEFQNEAFSKSFNRVSPGFATRTPNRPWVGTSYSTDDPAYGSGTFPTMDLGTGPMGDLHPTRTYNAHILDCCAVNNVYFKSGRALVVGEPDRYGWRGNTNRRQAELSANASRAGAVGAFFHSMRGERCEVFDPETMDTADGWFGGYGPI